MRCSVASRSSYISQTCLSEFAEPQLGVILSMTIKCGEKIYACNFRYHNHVRIVSPLSRESTGGGVTIISCKYHTGKIMYVVSAMPVVIGLMSRGSSDSQG